MTANPPVTPRMQPEQSLFLDGLSWKEYSAFLHILGDQPGLRFTYDRGRMEIVVLSLEHESLGYLIGRLVDTLTEELGLPIVGGRSTTLRRQLKNRGLESDNCYWIENAAQVKGVKRLDLKRHPPPDLALEVDITHSSLDRMKIYAALRVPQVWRFDGQTVSFLLLQEDGCYGAALAPPFAPFLRSEDLLRFIGLRISHDDNGIVREFRLWVRQQINTLGGPSE